MSLDDEEGRALVEEVEARLADVDRLGGDAGATAVAAVEALVDLYGAAFGRVLTLVTHTPAGDLFAALVTDELVGHVLMAHGLVPAPPELMAATPRQEAPVTFIAGAGRAR
jgi:hypothetical protein